ncbi:acyl-CoA dehydrogenase family protein, partial [Ilumatobacter sp.]|uniref:acyl-CoA dehydrogenase family protein n=1 Tax=Ilumatobacter sp. TaxID=1967498 RepID=UPI003AF934C9
MDFDLPAEDDPRRLEVRAWLDRHPEPSNETLHEGGYIVPHWPAPYGLEADPMHQLIIDDELKRAGVTRTTVATNAIGVGWAAPTIYLAGSDWQKERFLDPIFRGDEVWCQLFSEPDSGSDLAGLGTRAVRDGDEYVINGSKIWSSGAHHSQFGILIARTNPDVPKHKGISYFIVPMDLPGITLSPIVDMTTAHSFNQTFFDDVRLPAKYLVGDEGEGWKLAKVTLANERVSLSSAGSMWGTGPSASHLLDLVRANGGVNDPIDRQRFAALHIESEVLRLGRLRTLSARLQGKTPG